MTSFPLGRVLLPAVFISSAVFSALTLPFAFIKSEPVVINLPPLFNEEIEQIEIPPIFNGEHKEVAIPYIGFAIVVSVGAGIASVEVHRRWQAYRSSAMEKEPLPNLQQNSKGKETKQEAPSLLEFRPEASAIDFSKNGEVLGSQSPSTPNAMAEANLIAVEIPEQVIGSTQEVELQSVSSNQTTAPTVVSKEPNLFQEPHGNSSEYQLSSQVGSQSAIHEKNLALSEIIESRKQYQTCRIEVPHLKRSLLAIEVNGEYYSFFRAEKTIEKVQDLMAKLGHRVKDTVITKTEKSYVIWALEPEVYSKK